MIKITQVSFNNTIYCRRVNGTYHILFERIGNRAHWTQIKEENVPTEVLEAFEQIRKLGYE